MRLHVEIGDIVVIDDMMGYYEILSMSHISIDMVEMVLLRDDIRYVVKRSKTQIQSI